MKKTDAQESGEMRQEVDCREAVMRVAKSECFKDSFVTPILKKSGLDEACPSSYRPISNLSVISSTLIYGSCRPDATSLFSTAVSQCLDSIASWIIIITRKRAIAKALQLEGHHDFAPVDLALSLIHI